MSLASARERALEMAERMSAMGMITVTRFFGGAGLLMDGTQFAFVMKGALYLRVDDASRPSFEALNARPFTYPVRARTVSVASYYELPDEIADDPDELMAWARQAHRAAVNARISTRRRKR